MSKFMEDINFLIQIQKMAWKTFLTYRSQALVWSIAYALTVVNMIVAITVIYNVSSGIPGWTYFQVLALSSIATMVFGMAGYFIVPWTIVSKLRRGGMDMWFTKPYSHLLLLSGASIGVTSLVNFVGGVLLFTYAALHLGLQAAQLAYFTILFIAGTSAFFMFLIMITLLSYRILKSGKFANEMLSMLENVGRYPISIYGIVGQLAFTLAIPIGLAYYYPAEALFGRIDPSAVAVFIVISIAVLLISRKLVYVLLKSYSSGGG